MLFKITRERSQESTPPSNKCQLAIVCDLRAINAIGGKNVSQQWSQEGYR